LAIHSPSADKTSAFEYTPGSDGHSHAPPVLGVRRNGRNGAAARAYRGLKPMRFVSLHHHSTLGSYLDGVQMPDAHARRIAELNGTAIAMTEHGNIDSHVKLEAACRDKKDVHKRENPAYGIKPLFGVEVYMGKVGEGATQRKYHLTLVAKDQVGYRNLLKLVSLSYAEGFYHEPTVSPAMLRKYRKGLVVLSGCLGSLLACSCVGGKLVPEEEAGYERGLRVARWFSRHFEDYYIEVQAFPELEKTRRLNPMLARIAHAVRRPLVATMDCHYTVPTEAELQKVLHNVRPGEKRTLEELERDWGYDVPLCPPATDNTILRRLKATGLTQKEAVQSIIATEEIAQACSVTLPRLPQMKFPVPTGYKDAQEYWRHLLKEGWRLRGFHRLPRAERERAKRMLAHEMDIIERKAYVDYLLIFREGVVFAKDYKKDPYPHGIPNAVRGSALASVACYLLRITELNPLNYPDLVFGRFIDESRQDPPDIDCDFDADGRGLVRDFYVAKYGEECVANVGTFTYYKSKLALDDVARVHRIPKYDVEEIKDVLIERSSGDLRASATIEDTIAHFDTAAAVVEKYPELNTASDLEGNVKSFGIHAAGLLVANDDIRQVCAVYERVVNKKQISAVSMDKYDAERQGAVKLDFLSLSTLSMLTECLNQTGMDVNDLYNMPFDDPKVIDGYIRNDHVGVFQLAGRAASSLNGSLKAENFDEICAVIALCRPGPLHSGAAHEYVDIKRGVKDVELAHPALASIVGHTRGQIVYQEQILRIVTELGNFDWTSAAHIRRIMSKKHGGAEFNREWKKFWKGCKTYHKREGGPPISEAQAQIIWNFCITAGAYAFNAAHCRGYGAIGYWTMFFKQYYTPVFYAASLAKLPNKKPKGQHESPIPLGTHADLIRDARDGNGPRKPIRILKPSYSKSRTSWYAVNKKSIRAGFRQLPDVGEVVAQQCVDERAEHGLRSWDDLMNVKGLGEKRVEKIKAWVKQEDPFRILTMDRMLADVREALPDLGLPLPTHVASEVPYERSSDIEVVWLGVLIDRNLRDIFESHRARTGDDLDPKSVKHPELRELAIFQGTDGGDILSVRIDRFKYPKFKDMAWNIKIGHDIVLVRGYKPGWRTAREVYVSDMWVINPQEETK
jgi:DNA polymerase-3 subunit alpha